MKLDSEFYRLPLRFDTERLKLEATSFAESDWIPHPMDYRGNTSIPLISVNGGRNDNFAGPMAVTPELGKCPYIKQVIASFDEVFGRSRLMRLEPGSEVPVHSDINYHWYSRVRIHIPIVTFPEVIFYCGNRHVHMKEGETWIFNSWEMHKVINGSDRNRIHLVIDTSGSSRFWDLVSKSDQPHREIFFNDVEPAYLPFDASAKTVIKTEKFNAPVVMTPGELDALCIELINDVSGYNRNSTDDVRLLNRSLNAFRQDWRAIWAQHGPTEEGWNMYETCLMTVSKEISTIDSLIMQSNKGNALQVLKSRILSNSLNPQLVNTCSNIQASPANIPDT